MAAAMSYREPRHRLRHFLTAPRLPLKMQLLLCGLTVGFLIAIFLMPLLLAGFAARRQIDQQTQAVLATDPAQLAEACRQAMTKPQHNVKTPSTNAAPLPAILQHLEPFRIESGSDFLALEMGGSFHRYGVFYSAVPQARTPHTTWTFPMRLQELGPGLWLYEEGLPP